MRFPRNKIKSFSCVFNVTYYDQNELYKILKIFNKRLYYKKSLKFKIAVGAFKTFRQVFAHYNYYDFVIFEYYVLPKINYIEFSNFVEN